MHADESNKTKTRPSNWISPWRLPTLICLWTLNAHRTNYNKNIIIIIPRAGRGKKCRKNPTSHQSIDHTSRPYLTSSNILIVSILFRYFLSFFFGVCLFIYYQYYYSTPVLCWRTAEARPGGPFVSQRRLNDDSVSKLRVYRCIIIISTTIIIIIIISSTTVDVVVVAADVVSWLPIWSIKAVSNLVVNLIRLLNQPELVEESPATNKLATH